MTIKLYVGNLSYDTKEATLSELFASVGAVTSVSLITDRATGRSKGFAFVEMASDTVAQQCIAELNGRDVDGRSITVAEARPKREDDRGGRGGDRRGGDRGGERSRRW